MQLNVPIHTNLNRVFTGLHLRWLASFMACHEERPARMGGPMMNPVPSGRCGSVWPIKAEYVISNVDLVDADSLDDTEPDLPRYRHPGSGDPGRVPARSFLWGRHRLGDQLADGLLRRVIRVAAPIALVVLLGMWVVVPIRRCWIYRGGFAAYAAVSAVLVIVCLDRSNVVAGVFSMTWLRWLGVTPAVDQCRRRGLGERRHLRSRAGRHDYRRDR